MTNKTHFYRLASLWLTVPWTRNLICKYVDSRYDVEKYKKCQCLERAMDLRLWIISIKKLQHICILFWVCHIKNLFFYKTIRKTKIRGVLWTLLNQNIINRFFSNLTDKLALWLLEEKSATKIFCVNAVIVSVKWKTFWTETR